MIIMRETFLRTQSSWMVFISTQPAVHAAPCHVVGLFSLFSISPPLGDYF